jgi:hypothetical protein
MLNYESECYHQGRANFIAKNILIAAMKARVAISIVART